MRSTNIVIFLVLLNGAMAIMATALGPAIGVAPATGGGGAIENAQEAQQNLKVSRSALDAFVSATLMAANYLLALKNIVFLGPEMLRNIGTPDIIVSGFEAVVAIVFGIDMAEILSGRQLS